MTFAEWEAEVRRTSDHPTRTKEEQIPVFALGVAGEAGEVCDIVKKHIAHGKAVDRLELAREIGDVLWYLAALADGYGMNLDECAQATADKLRVRYPLGFRVQS